MRAALLSLVFVVVAGCKVKNPNYCEDTDSHLCVDGGADAADKCSSDTQCDEGVCKMPPGICVGCEVNADCTNPAMPACNTTSNKCEKCTSHAQCASDVCMPDGMCGDDTQVLFVKAGEAGTACTKQAPCGDVNDALTASATKSIVRIKGTINDITITLNNRNMMFLGDGASSKLTNPGGNILVVTGSSNVSLYDLEIVDAAGSIGVTGTGHTGKLELHRCTIARNRVGISYGADGMLLVRRSTVNNNNQGGMSISNTPILDIQNNFVFRNGQVGVAGLGGISVTGGSPSSVIKFNTIVDNGNQSGTTSAGGFYCNVSGVDASNNIVARNQTTPVMFVQINGSCTFAGTVEQPSFAGLIFESPDVNPFDYHLKPGSTASVDKGTGTAPADDVDGEKRPNGNAPDVGADELY